MRTLCLLALRLKDTPQTLDTCAAGTGLMIQLQTSLEAQVKALLQLGDTLYREGKLRAAIAAWRTVLSLSPEHPEAGAKIQRARHVLEKLERLRQRQGGTGGLSPRSGT